METVRFFLAIAAQSQWPIFQLDVKVAFLNGDLHVEVYVTQPESYVHTGKEGMVYRLKKALYGLRQAPRAWYSKINCYFSKLGFTRSQNELAVYKHVDQNSNILFLCLYVDDILYMGSSLSLVREFKDNMMKTFEMTNLGLLQYFLGLEVSQQRDSVFVHQKRYAENLMKKFWLFNSKGYSAPLNPNEKLHLDDSSGNADEKKF